MKTLPITKEHNELIEFRYKDVQKTVQCNNLEQWGTTRAISMKKKKFNIRLRHMLAQQPNQISSSNTELSLLILTMVDLRQTLQTLVVMLIENFNLMFSLKSLLDHKQLIRIIKILISKNYRLST